MQTYTVGRSVLLQRCGDHSCPSSGCHKAPRTSVPGSVHRVLATSGRPLEPSVGRTFGGRLGADFGSVRVHIDPVSARDVHAHAYTVGEHIIFDAGQYEPGSRNGQRLIAHELTHVLQQRAAGGGVGLRRELSQPNDPSEQRAEAVADAVSRGEGVSTVEVSSGGDVLARQADETGLPEEAAGQERAAAEEAVREDGAAVAEFDEWDAYDGDTPLAGPILPVPETPEQLEEAEAAGGTSAALTEPASESVEEPAVPPAGEVAVQRQAKKGKAKSPPTFPVPATLKRWITTIEIDLTAQTIKINWSDGSKPQTASISSGRGRPCTNDDPCADQNNVNCTPVGPHYHPQFLGDDTFRNRHGDRMSWYVDLGIQDGKGNSRGIGIHDSQSVKGVPASHGCVRVSAPIAKTINKNVIRSTTIEISGKAATKAWPDKTCPPKAKKGRTPASPTSVKPAVPKP